MSKTSSRTKRRLLVPAAVVVLSTGSLAALSTGAWFTDSQAITGNTFASGDVDISVTPVSNALTLTGMAPGDVVTAEMTVSNAGSLGLKYDVRGSATAPLGAALTTQIKSGVTSCTTAGFAASGTSVYSGNIPTTVTSLGSRPEVAAGGSEKLCFQVSLPGAATGNTYENTSSTMTFVFDAVQTKNNP